MVNIRVGMLFFLLTSSSFLFAAAGGAVLDSIVPGHPLTPGDSLVSSGGRFALGFFTPSGATNSTGGGGLYIGIWYNKIPVQTVVWVANRRNPVTSTTNATFSISIHGTLSISNNSSSSAVWSAEIQGLTSPAARLLDDGNLVVFDSSSPAPASGGGAGNMSSTAYAWQSFDDPTDTLLPGMKLGRTGGSNLNLTSWSSAGDPSPGEFTLSIDLRGDPQMALWDAAGGSSTRLWRSGPWTGTQFSGMGPETHNYDSGFVFGFVDDARGVYYTYRVSDPSVVSRFVIDSTGVTQQLVWIDGSGGGNGSWSVFWYTPKTQCDKYAPCGPYGVCDPNGSPPCSCLPGFVPRSPADWNLRDGSSGCVRKTELDCRRINGTTDGFATMGGTTLPDTVDVAAVDRGVDLGECGRRCSANCSCTGYANADVRNGGSGCIMWVGTLIDIHVAGGNVAGSQVFFYRLAAADLVDATGNGHGGRHVVIIAVLSTVFGFLFVVCMCYCYLRRRRKRRALDVYSKDHTKQSHDEEDLELPIFDYVAITAATSTFSMENKLGEGGFGPVYKGRLREGQEIAVKMLAKTSVQGIDEFKNEVKLMAKLQHRNLVRLLGCCIHENERMLIYEYMPNRSLDAFLFEEQGRALLDWAMRYRIIGGIARGLLYLHQDSRFRIIHRDLKASNILLDKDMTPKISDFGLARAFGGEETREKTRRVVGTYGYMAPEYAMDGIFSVKSDVFSFGVVVLEIISGKRNKGVYLSEPDQNLLGSAWRLWREGNGAELADPSMDNVFAVDELQNCLKVGLLCVQEHPEDRPNMANVLLMLSGDGTSLPEPKKPGFAVRQACSSQPDSSSSGQQQNSMNYLSYTMVVPR